MQHLCYVTFFDILHHYGVIAASQICSVSRKYCAVLQNRFFSFACIDLKFCKQPPDHCRMAWISTTRCATAHAQIIFFSFAYIDLKLLTQLPFLFWPQFCRLGYAVSALKYVETALLLYYYYHACEAGEGIIGHRGIRFVCLSVVCLSSVCPLSVVCLLSVCRVSVIKLLPAYGSDHYQNARTGSSDHCKVQSRFDIHRSLIPRPQCPSKNDPQNENFYFFDVLT